MTMSIVAVDCENLSSNPRCPHGPMVKFSKRSKGTVVQIYSCTACRDAKDCPFSLSIDDTFSEQRQRAIEDAKSLLAPRRNHEAAASVLQEIRKLQVNQRQFCKTCFEFILPSDHRLHQEHQVVSNVSDEMLHSPMQFISAKTNDKKEAQYWFDEPSKSFTLSVATQLQANAVLCIGTPSVFEEVRKIWDHRMLLDIDARYMTFYSGSEFGWFNMMNFHFLSDEKQRLKALKKVMKRDKVCIFVDPPFGVRLELLAYTIDRLRSMTPNVFIFLALPYFMEPLVSKHLNLHMLDYVIHYANHSKMKTHKKSAVRFFTNVALQDVKLPPQEGYEFCFQCGCWRHKNNVHCDLCETCPSKNASTYKHCVKCGICVKATWEHCEVCGRCFLAPHSCDVNPLKRKRKKTQVKLVSKTQRKNAQRRKKQRTSLDL